MRTKKVYLRLKIVFLSLTAVFTIIILRLFWLEVVLSPRLTRLAHKEHLRLVQLPARRGRILDTHRNILVDDIRLYSLYADPKIVDNKDEVASAIATVLGQDRHKIRNLLTKDKRFVWLARKLSLKDKKAIEELGIKGIGFREEEERFYPQGNLLDSVIGRTDIDNNGIDGLELFYEHYLHAESGQAVYLRDSRGNLLPLPKKLVLPKDGYDLILTVDSYIQYWVEKFLHRTVVESRAKAGAVVVLNPQNGEIVAMANFVSPLAKEYLETQRRNRCVCDFYEPGSVFKVVTLLAALDKDKEIYKEDFFCEKGQMKIPGSILHDWRRFGKLSFIDVFKNSSNIGVAKIANRVGIPFVYSYIEKLGFGRKTGIDFPGETSGSLRPLSQWSKTDYYIVPIGQSIGVSLLQLAVAFAAVANGGYIVRPHLVKEIASREGVAIKQFRIGRKGPIASRFAVDKAREILLRVVEEGTGRRAKLEKVKVCGKTGTSQKIDVRGGYSHRNFYASFVGFFPYRHPQFLIAVFIDEPHTYHYGGMIAAPLFKKIAEKIVAYKNLRSKDNETGRNTE